MTFRACRTEPLYRSACARQALRAWSSPLVQRNGDRSICAQTPGSPPASPWWIMRPLTWSDVAEILLLQGAAASGSRSSTAAHTPDPPLDLVEQAADADTAVIQVEDQHMASVAA